MPFWTKKKLAAPAATEPAESFFSTHRVRSVQNTAAADALRQAIARLPVVEAEGAQDDSSFATIKANAIPQSVSTALSNWYASQGFIGWQLCAILAQHWLINKACSMPARDATRNGFDVVSVDGEKLDDADLKLLKAYDRAYRIKWNAEQFVRMGRIFGIRIAIYKVDSTDPDYYKKPFNPDGVTPGSYKGISQVDPYWCAPLLDSVSTSDPASMHFYEPAFWIVGGKKYHRSHLSIFRSNEPPDILKPTYLYGGIPVSQQIMERVYAAERVANEGPLLAQSKRTNVWLTNMKAFTTAGDAATQKLLDWVAYRDNYGIKLGDKDGDQFQQFETSLADLDSVIMTQYQLVAAAANVPATKLLGTTPKGFNSTGEYEEANYHEELESIQEHDLTAFVERHHMLTLLSNERNVETTVNWRPLDAPTALELAQTNLAKAQAGTALVQSGAILPEDERRRVATDPDSGYAQLGSDDADMLTDLGLSDASVEAARELGIGGEE